MNYDKKRKRQNGRQALNQKPFDRTAEWDRFHALIEQLIADGVLPTISYTESPPHVSTPCLTN